MFDQCLRVPGNELTTQTAIGPSLINLGGIILDPRTHAAAEAHFMSECVIPLQFRPENQLPNTIPLYPDFTVGLRLENFEIAYQ